jgi:hypothetical protein
MEVEAVEYVSADNGKVQSGLNNFNLWNNNV